MKGSTIHNAGMLDVGQQTRQLNHTDVEIPFTKNANLKWIIIDEIGMVSDHLLGSFATAMDDASNRPKRFKNDIMVKIEYLVVIIYLCLVTSNNLLLVPLEGHFLFLRMHQMHLGQSRNVHEVQKACFGQMMLMP